MSMTPERFKEIEAYIEYCGTARVTASMVGDIFSALKESRELLIERDETVAASIKEVSRIARLLGETQAKVIAKNDLLIEAAVYLDSKALPEIADLVRRIDDVTK